MKYRIPFNKPYATGVETTYIQQAMTAGKISGDGLFTKQCQAFFEQRYGFKKCLLTPSCTAALEMAAILIHTQPGDEIIAPSYTFVSTVNAFVLRGANIVFADSQANHPNIEEEQLEALITPKTKAIVVVHYAGTPCNMNVVLALAEKYNLFVIEDAAQAVDSYYTSYDPAINKPLGGIGHLAAFSFHETKNIMAGEGGMLVINEPLFIERAEIIREKGTNRAQFFRGKIERYQWIDVGSAYLPSEITAAFLFAQLEHLDDIQRRRTAIWQRYYKALTPLKEKDLVALPRSDNASIFYLVCRNQQERDGLINFLKTRDILAVFHYLPLHSSPYYQARYKGKPLPHCDRFAACLVRLPLYYELTEAAQEEVIEAVFQFYNQALSS
ncbi:MAG: dTDP-4-amino-4,6-dideoxygalactose transaminase [Thermonemataceae bacterium]|mgnify:CR=1 FL=1